MKNSRILLLFKARWIQIITYFPINLLSSSFGGWEYGMKKKLSGVGISSFSSSLLLEKKKSIETFTKHKVGIKYFQKDNKISI